MTILHHDTARLPSLRDLAMLTALLVVAGVTYLIGRFLYNIFLHPLRVYPGPKLWAGSGLPWLYHSIIAADLPYQVHAIHQKYGSVVRINPHELSYNTAQAWRDIYGFRHGRAVSQLPKASMFFQPVEKGLPKGIILANDTDHTRMRRNMAHAFSAKALDEQMEILQKYFQLLIQRLREHASKGAPLDMVSWYNFTTFDLIGDLAFGESFHCLETSKSHPWIDNLFAMLKSTVSILALRRMGFEYLSIKLMPKVLMQKRAQHFSRAKDLITARIARPADSRPDFMSSIIKNQGKPGYGMTDAELVPNASTIVFAGSETTASLLSGVTYYLLKNPAKLERLVEEIREAFPSDEDIDYNAASRLEYLMAVLNEGLRMYPPVGGTLPRVVIGDGDMICGKFVPPGTAVGVNHWSASRSAANWRNPDSFVPERWLENNAEYASDIKDSIQPFNVGPRNCIGKNLAYTEMRQILAKVLWNFDLELAPESDQWSKQRLYTLWEKGPLMVKLTPRS